MTIKIFLLSLLATLQPVGGISVVGIKGQGILIPSFIFVGSMAVLFIGGCIISIYIASKAHKEIHRPSIYMIHLDEEQAMGAVSG